MTPNILLIMADQLRYDCVGFAGMSPVATPNIDRLAAEGMSFATAFSPIPVCGPARQSLVCGRRAETFGGLWNAGIAWKVSTLAPSAYSWARTLQEHGYRSGYVGKWDVHPTLDPTHYGYDEFVDSRKLYAEALRAQYPDVEYTGGYLGEVDPLPLEDTLSHRTSSEAGKLLQRLAASGGPWQLRVNFDEPHLPCRPTAEFAKLYDARQIAPWGSFAETFAGKPYIQAQQLHSWGIEDYGWEEWAPIVARYFAVISQLDDAIGRLLKQLDDLGLRENTLVVFTSDHGDLCGGHRMMDKHYVMYEDVIRVPMVMRWPGVIRAGSQTEELVYNLLDLPPTLLQACGLANPEDCRFHGQSLVPLWKTGSKEQAGGYISREEIVCTYNGQQFGLFTQRMIRTREWKYVWNLTDVDELYDLRNDPHELNNQIGVQGHRELIAGLRRRLYEILKQDEDPIVANQWMQRQLLEGRKL
ncbi:sulfatase-like hydrolase/transferase [Paenibacillus cremeus]|nr:sulfatase-like hydrolase/transferase [Paenibacillus cremeus]